MCLLLIKLVGFHKVLKVSMIVPDLELHFAPSK